MIDDMDTRRKKLTPLSLLALQAAVIVFTASGVFAKYSGRYEVMSAGFLLFIGLEVFALGVYALIWQQIIKRFDLSVAYANRATSIFWSMIWAAVLFQEKITIPNIIGVIVIFAGIMVVNSDAA